MRIFSAMLVSIVIGVGSIVHPYSLPTEPSSHESGIGIHRVDLEVLTVPMNAKRMSDGANITAFTGKLIPPGTLMMNIQWANPAFAPEYGKPDSMQVIYFRNGTSLIETFAYSDSTQTRSKLVSIFANQNFQTTYPYTACILYYRRSEVSNLMCAPDVYVVRYGAPSNRIVMYPSDPFPIGWTAKNAYGWPVPKVAAVDSILP